MDRETVYSAFFFDTARKEQKHKMNMQSIAVDTLRYF